MILLEDKEFELSLRANKMEARETKIFEQETQIKELREKTEILTKSCEQKESELKFSKFN